MERSCSAYRAKSQVEVNAKHVAKKPFERM